MDLPLLNSKVNEPDPLIAAGLDGRTFEAVRPRHQAEPFPLCSTRAFLEIFERR
jgi:hypothetical protein